MMPVSKRSIYFYRLRGDTCKVLREFISSFFAVHIPSTEDGGLSAYRIGFPPVHAQLVHRFRG